DGALDTGDDVFREFFRPFLTVAAGEQRRQGFLPVLEVDANAFLEFRNGVADFEREIAHQAAAFPADEIALHALRQTSKADGRRHRRIESRPEELLPRLLDHTVEGSEG